MAVAHGKDLGGLVYVPGGDDGHDVLVAAVLGYGDAYAGDLLLLAQQHCALGGFRTWSAMSC